MKKRYVKAQVSLEYLLIIGLTLAVLIPTAYMFYNYSQTSSDDAVKSQINNIGRKILNSAESMYALGENSWITLELNMPESVQNITIFMDTTSNVSELSIGYNTKRGISESVFFSDIKMSGAYCLGVICIGPPTPVLPYQDSYIFQNLHPGLVKIKIMSKGGYVLLNQTS